jgi:hypothetical protein
MSARRTARAAAAVAAAAVAVAAALLVSAPSPARAFCGFFVSGADQRLYNNASHVVLLRKGNHTVMTMSNDYKGPPRDFAMVVPVPVVLQKKQVRTLSPNVFRHIDELTAPRLVEYWEQDPCSNPTPDTSGGGWNRPAMKMRSMDDGHGGGGGDFHVKIEAQFVSGEYEVVILSAEDSTGLDGWLRANHYKIPDGAADALAPYVRAQMKFFVAKVDAQKVKFDKDQHVLLSPLQFSFESSELRLPVRLGLLNADKKQDLIVWTLHPSKRFEVANYPNVTIPTNLEVASAVRKSFGAFYAELFDETVRHNQDKAIVTEYAWDTSSCDPCPGPPLDEAEVRTLGAARVGESDSGGWVVTRLHARYDKQTLSEDLVFRAAKAIVGGRADRDDGGGPQTSRRDEQNNFQGRYILRHYWAKKLACEEPKRNVWGGPPDGRQERFTTARDLAQVERGQLVLADAVRVAVPALGVTPNKKKPK